MHDEVIDYDKEEWWKDAALSNAWDNLKKLCVPICGLNTAAGVDVQFLADVNEPIGNAVVFLH